MVVESTEQRTDSENYAAGLFVMGAHLHVISLILLSLLTVSTNWKKSADPHFKFKSRIQQKVTYLGSLTFYCIANKRSEGC